MTAYHKSPWLPRNFNGVVKPAPQPVPGWEYWTPPEKKDDRNLENDDPDLEQAPGYVREILEP